jgi:hypothetical protein
VIHKKELRMINIRTLKNIKDRSLFNRKWSTLFALGLYQYSEENLLRVDAIFIKLIDEIIEMKGKVKEELIIEKFKTAVNELNLLNAETGEVLIETSERDDLCEVFDKIAKSANINCDQFEHKDITYKWREW